MSGSMRRFVEVVKQYPGQQQVNLSVEIEVPGSWFGGTEMGSLNASERRQKYKAQAVEYAEVREFPGASLRARKVKGFGRRRRVRESMCLFFEGNGPARQGLCGLDFRPCLSSELSSPSVPLAAARARDTKPPRHPVCSPVASRVSALLLPVGRDAVRPSSVPHGVKAKC